MKRALRPDAQGYADPVRVVERYPTLPEAEAARPAVEALRDVREMLERARRNGDRRGIEAAIERINAELDKQG